jgi:hypothetical protein
MWAPEHRPVCAALHETKRAKQKVHVASIRCRLDGWRSTFLHQFQEVDPASLVAGNNAVLPSESARLCGSITGERGQDCPCFQIPELQRVVPRSRNRTPPVQTHRHAINPPSVPLQRAQFASSFQIPDLQRVVPRSGNRTPSVRTHRHAIAPPECPCSVHLRSMDAGSGWRLLCAP